MLSIEDNINITLIRKMMTEKKTTLPSLKNEEWENQKPKKTTTNY